MQGGSICEVTGIGPVAVRPEVGVGRETRFLLRPEKVRLSRERPLHPETNCVSGKVEHRVYLGMVTEYHLKTERGYRLVAAVLNRRSPHRSMTWESRSGPPGLQTI